MSLRVGILGAAGIAPAAIIAPASRRGDVEILAVASRSASGAAAYAERFGIPRSYGSYAELVADDDIDLVYVALPPSSHAEWTIAALEAGRHVLCEKPSAMNATQARRMADAAERTGRRFIEAFHDRYHPLTEHLLEVVGSGRLGAIRHITGTFRASNPFDPESIRHDPALGGGALMDLGCYPAHWLRSLGGEPRVVSAVATLNPMGADLSMLAQLEFASGATGTLDASMDDPTLTQRVEIVGERGSITADGMLFPSKGHSVVEVIDGIRRVSTVAGQETYDHQLAAIVDALASGAELPTEGADAVATMTLIDAVYAAAGFDREEYSA